MHLVLQRLHAQVADAKSETAQGYSTQKQRRAPNWHPGMGAAKGLRTLKRVDLGVCTVTTHAQVALTAQRTSRRAKPFKLAEARYALMLRRSPSQPPSKSCFSLPLVK